jgi:PAS domain S-box-containing protein
MEGDAYAYLVKPLNANHLLSMLERALEKQRLTRALRESEERYRLVTESIMDSVFLLDVEGRLALANSRAIALTGYSEEDLRRRPIAALLAPDGADEADHGHTQPVHEPGEERVAFHPRDDRGEDAHQAEDGEDLRHPHRPERAEYRHPFGGDGFFPMSSDSLEPSSIPFLELVHRLAEAACQLGQLLAAEHYERDDQDHHQLLRAKSEHGWPLPLNVSVAMNRRTSYAEREGSGRSPRARVLRESCRSETCAGVSAHAASTRCCV